MNPDVHLRDQRADAFQLIVANRIGSMGAKGNTQARVVFEVVEQRDAFTKSLIGVAGTRIFARESRACERVG